LSVVFTVCPVLSLGLATKEEIPNHHTKEKDTFHDENLI